MKPALVDTDILSMFLRGHPQVVAYFKAEQSVEISAEIYADLRAKGVPLDDIDILIAGTAIANYSVLVTHNRKHFDRIEQLEVDDWSED